MQRYFDSHSHVLLEDDAQLEALKASGLVGYVFDAIDLISSQEGLAVATRFPKFMYPTLGIHPEVLVPGSDVFNEGYGLDEIESDVAELRKIYEEGKEHYIAIGECGLDFYWLEKSEQIPEEQRNSSKELQRVLFIHQVEFAKEVGLPLVIHPRGAEHECLQILNSKFEISDAKLTADSSQPTTQSSKPKALFHSYTGTLETAKEVLEAGYYISFNGILTFKSAENIREIFTWAWKHYPKQILAETDSPYLAPEPMRGKQNTPAYVKYIVEFMAELVDESLDKVASTELENSATFYGIDLSD